MLGGSLQAFRGRVHVTCGLRNFLAEVVGGAVHRAAEPSDALGALLLARFGEVGGRVAQGLCGAVLEALGCAADEAGFLRALAMPAGSRSILFLQGLIHDSVLADTIGKIGWQSVKKPPLAQCVPRVDGGLKRP